MGTMLITNNCIFVSGHYNCSAQPNVNNPAPLDTDQRPQYYADQIIAGTPSVRDQRCRQPVSTECRDKIVEHCILDQQSVSSGWLQMLEKSWEDTRWYEYLNTTHTGLLSQPRYCHHHSTVWTQRSRQDCLLTVLVWCLFSDKIIIFLRLQCLVATDWSDSCVVIMCWSMRVG